jgi:hypothetical protein
MISKVSTLILSLAIALVWGTTASAQTARYPITGTYQFQIGDGLPIPIAVPADEVEGAGVRQPTAGPDPRPIQFNGGELTHPGTPVNLPVFANNSNVFQVRTAITIAFPKGPATLSAGGRTGAAVVSWCPGQAVSASGNPGCTSAGAGPGINGRMRYAATGAQFGGVAQAAAGGKADVALKGGAPAPCNFVATPSCIIAFALATPQGTAAAGAEFDYVASTAGAGEPTGVFRGTVGAAGNVVAVTTVGLGPGLPNPATSHGGPWTTGMLSLTNTAAVPPEIFTLSGSDNRVNGIGTISLVSGTMSARTLSGPNANRGWLSITVGETTPALGTWGIGALAVVLAGVAARRLRKRA